MAVVVGTTQHLSDVTSGFRTLAASCSARVRANTRVCWLKGRSGPSLVLETGPIGQRTEEAPAGISFLTQARRAEVMKRGVLFTSEAHF